MTSLDPITVEIIGSSFLSITDEMGETLIRSSFSTNIKERRDCSTAIFDPEGQVLCQAEHIPMHLGSFLGVVAHIVERCDLSQLSPGDVFIGNDAYQGGGTHLPDFVLAEPVFIEGRLQAWVVNLAHHSDFVDRGHAHIYQEGLRIPPVRLYKRGELQQDIQALILLNCQIPDERLSDMRAQMAANRLGVQRLQALCAKYGPGVVTEAGKALQDYAEKRMRAGIRLIPDGIYRFADRYDLYGLEYDFPLAVKIEVEGSDMEIEFDAPPQVRAGINLVYTGLLASVYYAIKSLVDPEVPPNSGIGRPLSVRAPKGSVLNCECPAAVNSRVNICQRVVDLIYGALGEILPYAVTAASNGSCTAAMFSGTRENGQVWAYLETIGGGMGARCNKDGLDGVHVHMTNTSNLPAEAMEQEYPLTLLRYELVENSGGPGTFRGGMGMRRVYRAEADCRLAITGSRIRYAPWGLGGGHPGGTGAVNFAAHTEPFSGNSGVLHKGDVVEIVTPGSGGYGPPAARDAQAVAEDVADGCIDERVAREVYCYTPEHCEAQPI
jgi:N-methylhydantoinase B